MRATAATIAVAGSDGDHGGTMRSGKGETSGRRGDGLDLGVKWGGGLASQWLRPWAVVRFLCFYYYFCIFSFAFYLNA